MAWGYHPCASTHSYKLGLTDTSLIFLYRNKMFHLHSCILPLCCAIIWQLLHHHHVHHMLVPSKQHFSLWQQLLLCPSRHTGHDNVKFIGSPWKVSRHLQTHNWCWQEWTCWCRTNIIFHGCGGILTTLSSKATSNCIYFMLDAL